jgi:hypothetical protein
LPQKVADTTIAALRWLGSKEHPFIFWDDASRTYQPTPFGRAVLASGLPPQQCLLLKASAPGEGCRRRWGWWLGQRTACIARKGTVHLASRADAELAARQHSRRLPY